jgi:glycine/D-amino acid oxidase-like deaminating enzyme/nitrite reductase/ring-hydroxylating ferredoxin subunit
MSNQPHTMTERQSIWMATADLPTYKSLSARTTCDVCIVGAGIAGLTTAYLLSKQGQSVVVLEDGTLASGQTQFTTAHLTNAIDNRYVEIERMHGEEGARLAAESHTASIDQIERIVRDEQIDCDFERLDGYLFLSPSEDAELLTRELDTAHRAGLRDVVRLERAPIDGFDSGPCLRFPNQAQFHPLKYLAALASAITRNGGRIFTQTHADKVEGGSPAEVNANGKVVSAGAVVIATNTPINTLVVMHTKQAPYMTYAIGVRVPRGSVTPALYWDTGDPYHYIRLQRLDDGDDLLIVGGEDHKTGQADDTAERHGRLEAWARDRFPTMGQVEFAWGGQVMETIDGLAFIGRNPMDLDDNMYVVTGDSGQGMTHGTIAGMLLTDLIMGRSNRWEKLYDPARKSLRAAGTYVGEAVNMAAQYADWVTPGDVASEEDVAMDSGAVIRHGLSKVAVYRDETGTLHRCSAICPHLGCIVTWNTAEKTWDCPCHGSRFDKFGTVLNGPANKDLRRVGED